MTPDRQSDARPDGDHWLVRPASIRRLWIGFAVVLALTVLAQAVVSIKGYFGVDGWFVAWTSMVMTAVIGSLAWLSPLILLALAWRYLRHPDDNATTPDIADPPRPLLVLTRSITAELLDSVADSMACDPPLDPDVYGRRNPVPAGSTGVGSQLARP